MNKLNVCGRIGSDLNFAMSKGKGIGVLKFQIAITRKRKGDDGKYPTDWFNVVSFGKVAEYVTSHAAKGTLINVCGEIQNNNYVGKDGKRVYSNIIVADEIEVLTPVTPVKQNNEPSYIEMDDNEIPF